MGNPNCSTLPLPHGYFIWLSAPTVAPPHTVKLYLWATPTVAPSPSPPQILYLMGNTHCRPSPLPHTYSIWWATDNGAPSPTVTLFDCQQPLSPIIPPPRLLYLMGMPTVWPPPPPPPPQLLYLMGNTHCRTPLSPRGYFILWATPTVAPSPSPNSYFILL